MKKIKSIIIISFLILLTGCSTMKNAWDAFFMAKYDTTEYSIITSIRTNSEIYQENCSVYDISKYNFNSLFYKSLEFKNFTQNIPKNDDAIKLSEQLFELAKQAKEHYSKHETVTAGFCKLKMQQINRSSEQIQKIIGSKPR